jgi:nucleotide-binding universal stress UspA family protein
MATAEQVDLIVMATHGRTGLRHLAMGSVAERVVRMAPCPVLTIRSPGEDSVGFRNIVI